MPARPPRTRTEHELHFERLSARDFERLCLALIAEEGYEDVQHVGAAGGDRGVDISARRDGRAIVFQCKRVQVFGPAQARQAVKKVLRLHRQDLPDWIVLVVTRDLSDEARSEAAAAAAGIPVLCWGLTDLDAAVHRHPRLIERFFGLPAEVPSGPAPSALPPALLPDARAAHLFVGREEELRVLERHLLGEGEVRPVAICAVAGMPGVGKSYLADRFASEHAADFPGGYARLVLDPAAPAGPEALLAQLAGLVDLPAEGEGLALRVRERLLRPRTLLHVENVDSTPAAASAARLLAGLRPCAVILTGRRSDLGRNLGWEQVPLATFDEAIALRQLAGELGRPAASAAEEREQRELIAALGHLPLAVHLAAGYLRAGYRARTFLDRLRAAGLEIEPFDRADLAAAGNSERARRILGASFRLSLDLLERELGPVAGELLPGLHALGHAPTAGVGRSLGAALAGLSEEDFEELAARAAQLHLLTPVPRGDRPDGAWKVHPLLAEFLAREIPAGEALSRMTEWFLERLPKAPTGQEEEQGRRWGEVQAESAALAAWLPRVEGATLVRVERAGTKYAESSGPFRLWADLCERGLRGEVTTEERSNLLWTLLLVSRQAGDLDRALEAATEKAVLDRERGEEREAALARGIVADVLQARGQLDEALRIRQEEQLPVYERLGDVRARAVTLGKIADALQVRGQLDEALRIWKEEQLPVFERLGDVRARAVTLGRIADVLQARGQFDEALRIRQEDQLLVFERLGDARARAVTLGRIADVLQARGQLDEALRIRQEEQLPVFEWLGDVRARLVAWADTALNYLARGQDGDRECAADLLSRALAEAERLRLPQADTIRATLAEHHLPGA